MRYGIFQIMVFPYNYLKMLYRTQEIFSGRNFWQTMQVKAIGGEKLGK